MSPSVLSQRALTGPYRITPARLTAIQADAEALAYPLQVISPEKTRSTAEWLQALGKALGFPAHFGANFDALYDCLCDPAVMAQPACVLVLGNVEALDEESQDTLIAVLQAVADDWREHDRRFWALFNTAGLDLDPLPMK